MGHTHALRQIAQLPGKPLLGKEAHRPVDDLPLALSHAQAAARGRRLGLAAVSHLRGFRRTLRVCLEAHTIYRKVNESQNC
jgi:hypothetical protein